MLVPKNPVPWTLLIASNARSGHLRKSFHLFQSMQLEGVLPDRVTCLTILGLCTNLQALSLCRSVHAQLLSMGFGSEPGFIKSYSMCGDLAAARDAFDRIVHKSVSCWNAIIIAYEERDMHEEILELYRRMDARPNETTVIKALGACAALKNFAMGEMIHRESSRIGLQGDIFVANATLTMYTKCDQVEQSIRVLEEMPVRDVVSWNIILAASARDGDFATVVELFRKMDHQGVKPSGVTFVTVVQSVAHLANLELGRSIHSRILDCGVNIHCALHNALLSLYAKSGSVDETRSIFSSLPERNLVSWNTMLSACLDWKEFEQVIQLHWRMDLDGMRGDRITFVAVLSACLAIRNLAEGRSIHAQILAWLSPALSGDEAAVTLALAEMYAACGQLDLARELLEEGDDEPSVARWSTLITWQETLRGSCSIYRRMLLDGVQPSYHSFLAMITACEKQIGHCDVQEHFDRIQEHIREVGLELVPVVTTALVSLHTKLGRRLDRPIELFLRLQHRSVWSWVAMMSAATSSGNPCLAIEFFHGMLQDGIDPDEIAFTVALTACGEIKCLPKANAIFSWFLESGIYCPAVSNIVVNLLGNCGAAKFARTVFDFLADRQDPVAWGSMITAYALSGQPRQALRLHCEMVLEGIEQDVVTFVSLLFCCSHGGLVAEAVEILLGMQSDHGVDPVDEHYSCVVDLLGRCGHLQDAEELLSVLPVEPSAAQWASLLSASTIHLTG